MAQTDTFTVDPNGNMTSAGAPGMVDVTGGGTSSLGSLAPHPTGDPYTNFSNNLMNILSYATNISAKNNQILGGAKDKLTAEAQAPASATPFNPAIGAQSQIDSLDALKSGFEPAVTSISTQEANTAAALAGVKDAANSMSALAQPQTLSQGQTLTTRDGTVLTRAPSYLPPQIRPDTGTLDSYDSANGMWKSDEVAAAGNGAGSHGYGTGSGASNSTPNQSNNNPFGIKATAYTMKLAQSMGITTGTGTGAKDGGNFLQFESPTLATMFTRRMLQDPGGLYAKDTLAQALQTWSGGGYGAEILKGTGLDPQAYVKDLSGMQMDTLMQAMLKAEQGVGSGGVTGNAPGGSSAPSSTTMTDPKGNNFSPAYATRVQQIPPAAQKFILAGPGGVAYIDGDTAAKADPTGGFTALLSNKGPAAGIPVFTQNDIQGMTNLNNIVQYIQQMKVLVNQNLSAGGGSSPLGHAESTVSTLFNNALQTDPGRTKFQSYVQGVTSEANQLKALAGGSGSGLRITQTEISGIEDILPKPGDSWQTAQADIQAMDMKIAEVMHSNFPDVPADRPVTPAGWMWVKLSNGKTGMINSSEYDPSSMTQMQ